MTLDYEVVEGGDCRGSGSDVVTSSLCVRVTLEEESGVDVRGV